MNPPPKGFCLYCGLKSSPIDEGQYGYVGVHAECADAWEADLAVKAKRPKSSMEQQLDRIEGLLVAIRDRYSL